MTTQKDRIEAAIRHIQTSVDIDPWAMELAVDALKAQIDKDTNVPNNDDIISRQAALERLQHSKPEMGADGSKERYRRLQWIADCNAIEEVPSAQPELGENSPSEQPKTNELVVKTGATCTDAISRQAAIDAILAVTGNSSVRELYEHVQEHGLSEMWSGGVSAAIDVIIAVPSAQPEIVRCKDCKHWKQQTNYAGVPLSFGFCESDDMWLSLYGETTEVSHIDTDDDFYCGYAERRTDETD